MNAAANLPGPDLGKGRPKSAKRGPWIALKRVIGFTVSAALSILVLTAVLPPLVADQSDRAVVNAPVTLLTAPIAGEVKSLSATPGTVLSARSPVAEIVNNRIDRSTLINLEGKQTDTRENLQAIRAKKDSDALYVIAIQSEIKRQSEVVLQRYEQQVQDLQAQLGSATAASEEKKQLLSRQTSMVARAVAAPDMMKGATQQFAASQFQKESSESKLQQKQAQLDSARKGIYVGDDVHDLAALIQKKRDMEFDVQRLEIERIQVAAAVEDQTRLLEAERDRLASMERSTVVAPGPGEVLNVGAAAGRHVSAGDTLARMVDCDASFVVAIFSYRQGSDLSVGVRVVIDAGSGGTREGTIAEVLPKTSDKVDETYAVPFPQTERRELYVLIRPDSPLRSIAAAGGPDQCDIGRWVTVSRTDGWVPSTSVIWHQASRWFANRAETASNLVKSAWTPNVQPERSEAASERLTTGSIPSPPHGRLAVERN